MRSGCLGFGFGLNRTRKNGVVAPGGVEQLPTLSALTLSANSLPENAAAGSVVGAIQGATAGSVLSLSDDAGGRFAISGTNLVRGATALDYETATSHNFTVRETLSEASNSPRDTVLTLTVTNVFEQPNLSALTMSSLSFTSGTPASGMIGGATTGSAIVLTGGPAGLTINSAARTWAFDGSAAASGGNLTLTETLGDSANSPNPTVLAWAVAAAPPAGAITAPVLTISSAAGAAPVSFDVFFPDDTISPGNTLRFQVASDNTKNADGSYITPDQDITQLIDAGSWESGSMPLDGFTSPSGLYYAECWIERDDGVRSPVSNEVSDTIAASVARLVGTAGVDKNTWVSITNAGLTFTGTDGQDKQPVRTTIEQASAVAQFEVTVDVVDGQWLTGLDDGTIDLSGNTDPGYGNDHGIAVRFSAAGEIQIWWGTAFNGGDIIASNANNWLAGDTFTFVMDQTAGTLTVYRTRAGATTLIGSKSGLPSLAAYYAFVAPEQGMTGTFNFGASTYAKAPDTGVADYWA